MGTVDDEVLSKLHAGRGSFVSAHWGSGWVEPTRRRVSGTHGLRQGRPLTTPLRFFPEHMLTGGAQGWRVG